MQLIALLLLAQLSPWTPPGVVAPIEVASLIRAEDCGPSRCDWSPAIERAQELLDVVPAPQFAVRAPGGEIRLPCGVGDLSRPIVLRRGHALRGCGGTFPSAITLINVRTSTHAIVAPRAAAGFTLRDFAIITQIAAEKADRYAIAVGGRGEINEVSVRGGFVDGIHAFGDVNTGTNVNGLKVRGVRIDLVERAAIYVAGQDGNANTFDSVDVGSNCQRGSKWAEPVAATTGWSAANGTITLTLAAPTTIKVGSFLAFERLKAGGQVIISTPTSVTMRWAGASGSAVEAGLLTRPCANIIDLAFLNNTWIAIQTAGAKDRVTGEIFRSFIFGNPASRTVCLGCYAEQDQLPGWVSAAGVVLGGIGAWEGPGLRVEGRRVNGIKAVGMIAPGDTLAPEVWIGGNDWGPPGTVLTFMPPQGGTSNPTQGALRWRMSTTPGKRSWFADVANSAAAVAERISLEAGRFGVTTSKTSTAVQP